MSVETIEEVKTTVIEFGVGASGQFWFRPEHHTFGETRHVRFETKSGRFTTEFRLASPNPGFGASGPFPQAVTSEREPGGVFAAEFDLRKSGLSPARKRAARDANRRGEKTAVAFYRYDFTVTAKHGVFKTTINGGYDPPDSESEF